MTDVSSGSGLPLPALVETVKARVVAGDRDKQRSDDHYLAAGLGLIEMRQRLPVEEPGAIWFAWSCRATGYGPNRISQLIAIGEGRTTTAEINAATAESMRRHRETETTPRRPEQPRDASRDTSRPASAADRQQRRRDRLRSERVAAGADLPPPLAPIEHRRLLKEGRDILGRLDFERLKDAVAYAKRLEEHDTPETPTAEPASVEPTPESLFAEIEARFRAMSEEDRGLFFGQVAAIAHFDEPEEAAPVAEAEPTTIRRSDPEGRRAHRRAYQRDLMRRRRAAQREAA
jgi:hypothetical protein